MEIELNNTTPKDLALSAAGGMSESSGLRLQLQSELTRITADIKGFRANASKPAETDSPRLKPFDLITFSSCVFYLGDQILCAPSPPGRSSQNSWRSNDGDIRGRKYPDSWELRLLLDCLNKALWV
ncbi:MADS-box protein ZMM17 [Dissostichus eleginoides]|uniref:MADS-box protein ZMM17 n=1 Tax=Dissostichus eleginoides TaxID=100907 RepID=A0AAD9C3W7_DISEL|nr:MADS-box protein ZMM17 [Dissostichus eleginoides]